MPFFSYRARNRAGTLVTGMHEAESRGAAETDLDKMGLIPIAVRPARRPINLDKLNLIFQRVSPQDVILFSRQLATLFKAGIPLTRALATLERQMTNKRFTSVIKNVREDIEGGSTFAAALKKHPHIFDETYHSMVEAGEAGGILDEILDRLASIKERLLEVTAKVKAATLYPKIVLFSIAAAIFILMMFVVPKFSKLYSSFNVQLPLPTRVLILISDAFTAYWYLVIAAVAAPVVLFKLFTKTEMGRYQWDRWKLKIPVFGALAQKATMSKFSRVFGALYKSGLPILQSLDIVSRIVDNRYVAKSIKTIEEEIRAGKSLSILMENAGLFPPMVVQMTMVGEETGALDNMLEKVAQYYDQEVDYTVRNLTTILEPVLLIFIFGIVLFLALAIFLPMWDMVKFVKR